MKYSSLRQNKIFLVLSSLKITVGCLLLLFILTFWGTIAQVENGLFVAQQRYFHSFFFLASGRFPFPGAQLVLWVLFVNLLSAAITRYRFEWNNLGILLIHFGLLTYFISAFVTFHCVQESQLTLMEGAGSNVSTAYHDWELAVWQKTEGNKNGVIAYDISRESVGKIFLLTGDGFNIKVEEYYPNAVAYLSDVKQRPNTINDSGITTLKSTPGKRDPEKNIPGGIFEAQFGQSQVRKLLLYGGEDYPAKVVIQDREYFVQLRKKRFVMPFLLTLKDFKMEVHPNTQVAKSYESLVQVKNGDMERDVLISMNHPLRYKNFTFYQASYAIDALGREMSTLAVVKNFGRVLPYVASLITFLGLVTHFLGMGFSKKMGSTVRCSELRRSGKSVKQGSK